MIQHLMDFLNGKSDHIIRDIEAKMVESAENLAFEQAAYYRDQLKAIEKVVAKQKVVTAANTDQDVIAFARDDKDACVQIFFIRHGKLIGREYFMLEGADDENDGEILENFLTQFYDEAAHVPKEVLLPNEIAEAKIIEEWLRTKRGTKVTIQVPRRGKKKALVEMAATNASDTLNTLRQQWEADKSKHVRAMAELQEALSLPAPPARIECYDISHTQGKFTVGSMVVFVQGAPRKADYRRFNVKTVGNDDYGAMREVLTRRFQRYQTATSGELHDATQIGRKKEAAWALLPDLLVLDGGKGQLQVGKEVLAQFGLTDEIALAGLAKREEEVFLSNKRVPIYLSRRSEGLFLLQRVRDEAHRFANEGHRRRRNKAGVASILDTIPGIGQRRRRLLLQHFESLDGIRRATEEEIAAVPGIPVNVAQAVKAFLD